MRSRWSTRGTRDGGEIGETKLRGKVPIARAPRKVRTQGQPNVRGVDEEFLEGSAEATAR